MAGQVTIAQVEELWEPGEIDPNDVHLPGVFVQCVVPLSAEDAMNKRIKKLVTREAAE
jgi:3-oxoacid CoA-transferase subunit A